MTDSGAEKARVYTEFYGKVRAYIGGRITDSHDADELAGEVFCKIYRHWEKFDAARASLSTWIFTVTKNTVTDFFRTRRKRCEYVDAFTVGECFAAAQPDEDALEDLAAALEKLTARERDVVILHYYREYTLKRIAQLTGMSYANVKLVHARSLDKLRAYLRDDR